MKKVICSLLCVIAFMFTVAVPARAGAVNVIVNGSPVDFSDARPYINEDSRVMVPVRFISEQLGSRVDWDQTAQTVKINYKGKTIYIPVDKKYALIQGKKVALDTGAIVKNSRTFVPLRFVSEAHEAKVLWDSATTTVRISTADSSLLDTSGRNNKYKSPPAMVINPAKKYFADIKTNRGQFKIRLLASEAPNAVNNFVFLARDGFFNGIRFHRVIREFMIQTGDPLGNGTGGPGYTFADELPPKLPYTPGVLAMANRGRDTNGSQFFICTGKEAAGLNKFPDYTVFGEVIQGMEVVLKIADTPVEENSWGEISKPLEDVYIESVTIEEK